MKSTLPGLIFIVFLVLKLCSVISWSWWWITSPLWIFWAIFIMVVFAVAVVTINKKMSQRKRK